MVKKWVLTSLALLLCGAVALAGCNSGGGSGSSTESEPPASGAGAKTPAEQPKAEAPPETFAYTAAWHIDPVPFNNPTERDKQVMERFNITLESEYISGQNYLDRFNVMFASDDYPDLIMNFGDYNAIRQWGISGFLQPVNGLLDRMPNAKAMWTPEQWEQVVKFMGDANGNVYVLPSQNYRSFSQTWIYRKDIFDQLGLAFPATTEELYEVLKALKAAYPDAVPMSTRWGVGGALGGFVSAFRTNFNFFADMDQNNEVVYGPATDKYRDLLVYVARLYKENLFEKEFPTITEEQWREKYLSNRSLIEFQYGTNTFSRENEMKEANPSVDWEWARVMPGAYGTPGLATKELPFFRWGPSISNKVTGAKLDRILEYLDWSATPEGIRFHTMGVEGETYTIVDGKPKFNDDIAQSGNPNGKDIFQDYGYTYLMFRDMEYMSTNPLVAIDLEVSATFESQPHYSPAAFIFTAEDETEVNKSLTNLNDIRDQFAVKAIFGQADASSDAAWNAYLGDLEKAGLSKLTEIYRRSVK